MIEVRNIVKTFGATRALDGLTFNVPEGEAFGLLGRNGAGKTTCIRIIMDIFNPDSGEILINGQRVRKNEFKIGYLPEERGLYPNKIISDQMAYIGQLRGMTKQHAKQSSKRLLEELDASEYYSSKLSTLSKGNQQKIQLAISLINDPDIIILDEPFSGLDPVNAQILKRLVSQQVEEGKTVIFSSHQMSQVEEFCDDICIIDKGHTVLKGNLAEIKRGYPRNKIYIEMSGDTELDVNQLSGAGIGIAETYSKGSGTVVVLERESDSRVLLSTVAEHKLPIDVFRVQEPSLEDIFVEKVGGKREEL